MAKVCWIDGTNQEGDVGAYTTESVDDCLAHIEDKLPGIMKGAGVTTLVSKWDKEGMKKYAGAEQINVTVILVDALDPIEGQREFAKEFQGRDPVQ